MKKTLLFTVAIAAVFALPPSRTAAYADDTTETSGIKILLIGATSRTAKELIPQALAAGHEVIGLARSPEKVTFKDERLTLVKGDVYDVGSLEAAMTGEEIVISMLGPPVDALEETKVMDLLSTGTTNIIQAMKNKGNSRFIVASSSLAEIIVTEEPPAGASLYDTYLWNVRAVYQDFRDMETIVNESKLDFVISRPGFLIDEPARNNHKMAIGVETPKRTMVTYADFAAWTLEQVDSDEHLGKTVGIYSDIKIECGVNMDCQGAVDEVHEESEAAKEAAQ